MTWGLVIPVLPVYADGLGAGPAVLGGVVAAFGLGRLLVDFPAGMIAQRLDQRRLLVASVAAIACFTLLTAAVTSIGQLVAVRLLTGLAGGVAMTSGQALLMHTEPARLGRTMGALQAYQLAGGALGPVIGGVLVGVDARLPFVAGGIILVTLTLLGVLRPIPRWQPVSHRARPAGEPGPRLWTAGLVSISFVGFSIFLVRFGGQQFLFPVLAYDRAGLSPAQLGTALAVTTLLSLGLVRLAGSVTDRWGRRPVVVVSTATLGLVTLGFLGAGSVSVFLTALVLTGVATAFTGPPTGAYLADAVAPQKRGMAVGVYRTFGDLATLVGPLFFGWLVAAGAERAAVVILSGTTLTASALFTVLSKRHMAHVGSATAPATPPAGAVAEPAISRAGSRPTLTTAPEARAVPAGPPPVLSPSSPQGATR